MAGAPGQGGVNASPQQMIAQNMAARQMLLNTAPRMRKNLGAFNIAAAAALGGTIRVKLFNVGITTGLWLDITATIDVQTSTAGLSPKAPFNFINRVKVTDFDGTDRVNCSGYQLWVLQCIRNQTVYGYNNESQTAVLADPTTPTAVATSQTFRFQIEVPFAFDKTKDLRGALLTQTAVGECYLSIDFNTLLFGSGNADAVYNSGTGVILTAGSNVTVNVSQEYLLPQTVGGQTPLPVLDLMTVYELSGALRSSDNLAAGQGKLINYPNVRSVIGCYFNYINNSVMNDARTDVTRFRLIANGNNVLQEYSPTEKLWMQRCDMLGHGDLRKGTYWFLHRDKPIETQLFGNVQAEFVPASVSGVSNLELMFESFYTKGSTLPGLIQAG